MAGYWAPLLARIKLDLGSGGGEGLGETAVCLLEGGAGVADGDGYELQLSP